MKKLESESQYKELVENGKVVFLFSADWCPDCRFIEHFMPEIEAQFSQYMFVYVDRDQYIDICVENDIFGIPSFVAFDKGVELGRFVSKDRKTKEEIEQFLQAL